MCRGSKGLKKKEKRKGKKHRQWCFNYLGQHFCCPPANEYLFNDLCFPRVVQKENYSMAFWLVFVFFTFIYFRLTTVSKINVLNQNQFYGLLTILKNVFNVQRPLEIELQRHLDCSNVLLSTLVDC